MKNYRNKSPPLIKNAFTDICKDIISDKRKGCGIYCEVTEDYILCPSCETFVWHKSCLESLCKEFDMDFPDINTNKWKCSNCMWDWIFKIFNLNEFSKCFHLFRTKGVLRDEFSYNFWYISFVSKIFHWSLAYWSTKIIFYKRNKNTFFTTRSYSGWVLIHIMMMNILFLIFSHFFMCN